MHILNSIKIMQKGDVLRALTEFKNKETGVIVPGHYNLANTVGLDKFRKLSKALGLQGKLTHDCIARIHDGDLTMYLNADKEFQVETEYDDFYKEDVVRNVYVNASFSEALNNIRL